MLLYLLYFPNTSEVGCVERVVGDTDIMEGGCPLGDYCRHNLSAPYFTMLKPRRDGLLFSVYASHAVDSRFASRSGLVSYQRLS